MLKLASLLEQQMHITQQEHVLIKAENIVDKRISIPL